MVIWDSLYVLLFLFVNISLINIVLYCLVQIKLCFCSNWKADSTEHFLSWSCYLLRPTPERFHKAYATLNVTEKSFQLEHDLMTLLTDYVTNFQCYAVEGCSSLWLLTSWFAKREILLFEQNVYFQKSLVWLCYSACLGATHDCFLKANFCTHLLGPWCSCPSVVFVSAWTKSRWVCSSSDPLSVVQQSPGHQI